MHVWEHEEPQAAATGVDAAVAGPVNASVTSKPGAQRPLGQDQGLQPVSVDLTLKRQQSGGEDAKVPRRRSPLPLILNPEVAFCLN